VGDLTQRSVFEVWFRNGLTLDNSRRATHDVLLFRSRDHVLPPGGPGTPFFFLGSRERKLSAFPSSPLIGKPRESLQHVLDRMDPRVLPG